METKEIENKVNQILQKVHDDAVSPTHLPELGYSSRATAEILALITTTRREAYKQGALDMQEATKMEQHKKNAYDIYPLDSGKSVDAYDLAIIRMNTKAQQFIDSLEGKDGKNGK